MGAYDEGLEVEGFFGDLGCRFTSFDCINSLRGDGVNHQNFPQGRQGSPAETLGSQQSLLIPSL